MNKIFTNCEIAKFANKSEGWVRFLIKDKPNEYELLVEKYKLAISKTIEKSKKKIIACVNIKGGVGKSSILNILTNRVNNSVIINIDFTADAEKINSANTINYAPLAQDFSIEEVIETALEDYTYIFIDTPGDISDELMDIIEKIDYFILPFKPGERSMNGGIETYETLFTQGFVDGHHKISFIINEFINNKELEKELALVQSRIKSIKLFDSLTLEPSYTSLGSTQVMKTMERDAVSIDELNSRNKIAYKIATKRFDKMSDDIITHFELERKA